MRKRHLEEGLAFGRPLHVERKHRLVLSPRVKSRPRLDCFFLQGADPVHAPCGVLRELLEEIPPRSQSSRPHRLGWRKRSLDNGRLGFGTWRWHPARAADRRLDAAFLSGVRHPFEERREHTVPIVLAAAVDSHRSQQRYH
jgi:hypothetical protein